MTSTVASGRTLAPTSTVWASVADRSSRGHRPGHRWSSHTAALSGDKSKRSVHMYSILHHAHTQSFTIHYSTLFYWWIFHLEVSSTLVGHPGYCHSPVLAVKNVDIRQPILRDIYWWCPYIYSPVSSFWSSSRSHTFYLHVQHYSCHMAIIYTSRIPLIIALFSSNESIH